MEKTIDCIAGVSGGPDSMALLDMLKNKGKSPLVLHVNYQKRDTALRDENIVRDYCAKYSIPLVVIHPHKENSQNFQAWARDVRYDKMAALAKENGTDEIYIAHHLDDHLETYLFQKNTNRLADHFGLKEESLYKGVKVIRPLLKFEKKELEAYCIKHQIVYGIDESNLTDHYTRNRIRHGQIENMSRKDKEKLALEIEKINQKWERKKIDADRINSQDPLAFLAHNDGGWLLTRQIWRNTGAYISKKEADSLVKQLQTNCLIDLGGYLLERKNDRIFLVKKEELPELKFDSEEELAAFNCQFINVYYEIGKASKDTRKIERFHVFKEDFPITVRPAKDGDFIRLRNGKKKLHRFFIDRKIPRVYRRLWMVVENADGEIIFVPSIGSDVKHFDMEEALYMVQYFPSR